MPIEYIRLIYKEMNSNISIELNLVLYTNKNSMQYLRSMKKKNK